MGRRNANQGPSQSELRMKADLDRTRRELTKLKKGASGPAPSLTPAPAPSPASALAPTPASALAPAPAPAAAPAPAPAVAPAPAPATAEALLHASAPDSPAETSALRRLVGELTATRQRLSRLYFSQLEENRRRARRLHQILENIGQINSELDLDHLLARIAETISGSLGFRVVLIRIREPDSDRVRARAFVGVDEEGRARLQATDIPVDEFRSWLQEEFRVSRSYFISHRHAFSKQLPAGFRSNLGPREEWEWHEDDVLLIPLQSRSGDLVGYFSVDDPVDRLVPSTETIELLEIFGNHAVVAIENARLYQELEAQTRQLREAGQRSQELHALKSNFVSTISHELRTPLTALRAVLDSLLSAGAGEIPQDRLRQFLGIMNDETQRLARLIESVLDLNRFDSGELRLERQPVELGEIVEDTVKLLSPVAQTGQVSLKLLNDCADTRTEADPDQMRQLVLHLGSNAIKFTPAGGSVTVFLSGSADEIALRVEDTGIGIPEAALEKVFERFYQVDSTLVRRYGGAGLGLAVCKSIVEWHGGRITAESAPGRGSCFTVVLPRRSGPRVALRPDPSAPRAVEDLLRLAIEMVAEVMDARVVSLLAPGPDGELHVRAALGLDERVVREAHIPVGTGVAGWVAQNRRPVCVSNAQESSEIAGSGRERYRTRTFISVPLEGEDGLLGVLNVTDPVSGLPFDARDCELLLSLAERVGAAWAVLQAAEGGRPGMEDAARTLRQMLCHLERSRTEAPGSVRLARALARELGLSDAEIASVSIAAGLHDVGMARLPGSLRESATPFSSDERALMERHVEIGAELLKPIEEIGAVHEIVLSHHEWWDGTGYPRGLREDEIPIGARILAVVDAWESMTVGRTHRPARNEDDARLELRRLTGRQFDPRVVEAFERVLDAAQPQAVPEGTQAQDDANAIARR
jgi:signal transduction histidine kinase/response regulator RpfG family c-di-GMP phosphodiesterase